MASSPLLPKAISPSICPPVPDAYVEFIHPLTLPAGSTVIFPASGTLSFSLTASVSNFYWRGFPVGKSRLRADEPTSAPPLGQTNGCCLVGSASIAGTNGSKPAFTLTASLSPGCRCDKEDSGEFNVTANALKLQFSSAVAEIVPAMSPSILPQGKGLNGKKCNTGLVYFTPHVEDRSDAHLADAIYLRVYAADEITLLLINGDMANPTDVSPVSITSGNLMVGSNCCPPNNGHGKGEGEGHGNGNQGHDNGNQRKGDQDQGKGNSGSNQNKGNQKGWH